MQQPRALRELDCEVRSGSGYLNHFPRFISGRRADRGRCKGGAPEVILSCEPHRGQFGPVLFIRREPLRTAVRAMRVVPVQIAGDVRAWRAHLTPHSCNRPSSAKGCSDRAALLSTHVAVRHVRVALNSRRSNTLLHQGVLPFTQVPDSQGAVSASLVSPWGRHTNQSFEHAGTSKVGRAYSGCQCRMKPVAECVLATVLATRS
jgi:hypothetical protein